MEFKLEKDKLILIPENEYDCYVLGRLSVVIEHEIQMTKGTNEPVELNKMSILINEMLTHITNHFTLTRGYKTASGK